MLDFDLFTRVVDEAGPSLGRIDFFNYGEAFLHKRALEMCEYIKSRFPHVYLYTSTNGLALTEDRRGGWCARASTKSRSRSTARRRRATPSTGSAAISPRRSATCAALPTRSGRRARRAVRELALHPLHAQRQRRGDGAGAGDGGRDRRRSPVLGDHRPPREHVLAPLRARARPSSRRSSSEIWDDNNLGNAIPGATPRARIDVRQRGPWLERIGRVAPPVMARPGQPLQIDATSRNLSTRPFPAQASYGRRLVRLGAQLCDRGRHPHQPRLRARLAAGAPARRAVRWTCRSRSRRPTTPGRYVLKFDLVSEGIDWFEACGSQTTMKTLIVV